MAFKKVLNRFSSLSEVPYEAETQNYWRSSAFFPAILQDIVNRREILGPHLSPRTNKLAIRAACPHPSCGMADKHGINNQYCEGHITFLCPNHGVFSVNQASLRDLERDLERLEFNTPFAIWLEFSSAAKTETCHGSCVIKCLAFNHTSVNS